MKRYLLGLMVGLAACTGEPASGPNQPNPGALPAIISDPVRSSAPAPAAAYVSLPRGTFPNQDAILIRNPRTGAVLSAPLVLGGFDPVAIAAEVGDLLEFEVMGSAVIAREPKVPPRRGPIIVRTDPPPHRRDVPLNASLRIVFSEPIDPASLSPTAITLTHNGTAVSGTLRLAPGSSVIVEFVPSEPLEPETAYELLVTTEVRDSDGEALQEPLRVPFTTLPPPGAVELAFVSNRDGTPGIYVAKGDGSAARRLTSGESPAWSRYGSRLAFVRNGAIYVIRADGSDERFVTSGTSPFWSPDGTQLVFQCQETGGWWGFCLVRADGTGRAPVIDGSGVMGPPSWLHDGKLGFVRQITGGRALYYVANPDGTRTLPLNLPSGITLDSRRPAWSPDGSRFLSLTSVWVTGCCSNPGFTVSSFARSGGDQQIYLDTQPWDYGSYWIGNPDWSPDGTSIVLTSPTGSATWGSRVRIFVVSLADLSQHQLIPEAVSPVNPNYSDWDVVWSRAR